MTSEPIEFLARCLEQDEFATTESNWRFRIGYLFDTLRRLDLMSGPHVSEKLPCTLCDQPGHSAFVTYDQGEGLYQAYCVVMGITHLESADVEVWSFERSDLLSAIANSLGVSRETRQRALSADLTFLGLGELGQTSFGVYALRGTTEPSTFNKFLERNRKGFGPSPSIVLCADYPTIMVGDAGKNSLVRLHDIFDFDESGFIVNAEQLRMAIGLQRSRKKKAPKLKAAEGAFEAMLDAGQPLPETYEELRTAFNTFAPSDISTPGRTTLFNARRNVTARR